MLRTMEPKGNGFIIVRLNGGLGNQLFQYGTGLALARRTGLPLRLDLSGFETYKLHRYSLGPFAIEAPLAAPELVRYYRQEDHPVRRRLRSLSRLTGLRWGTYFPEIGLGLNKALLRRTGPTYLDGYWQCERYFIEARGELRRHLLVKEPASGKTAELLEQITREPGAVSLHVRRGDYVSDPRALAAHGLCGLDYYRRAVELVKTRVPRPHFYLFSDDPEWVRGSLKVDAPCTLVDHNDALRNYDDFRLMAACPHHVLANSSFSWWAAWLYDGPGKLCVAPRPWFANRARERQARQLIPEGWIRL